MSVEWDEHYRSAAELQPPAEILSEHLHLLPKTGIALDLACGVSGNGALFAEQGLRVEVWDTASTALARQQATAVERDIPLVTRLRDCEAEPPEPESFDVISVCHFLFRPGASDLIAALKPGGLLFYQTFTAGKIDPEGPSSPDYLLDGNELLELFAPLQLRYYREDGRCGPLEVGKRNRAYFIGQKL